MAALSGSASTERSASFDPAAPEAEPTPAARPALAGVGLVFRSRYLLSIVAIVGLYEVVSTLVDFQFTTSIIESFLSGNLAILLIVISLIAGAIALLATPREEEPQIVVPMIDVFVTMPGASAREVEQRVTRPMEKLLSEIPGVEYVYSTSSAGVSMVIVRFYVGQSEEDAIVRLNQKLYANFDRIPPGVSPPLIKPRRIDDVPILTLTLHGDRYDAFALRRIAAQVDDVIKQVDDVSETTLVGGLRRQVRVDLDVARLAAYGVDPVQVTEALEATNRQIPAGAMTRENRELLVETGGFLEDVEAVGRVVVATAQGRPVYVRDIATVTDLYEETDDYVLFGYGAARDEAERAAEGVADGDGRVGAERAGEWPAVTIAVAKRQGANAIVVADGVLAKVDALRGVLLPSDLTVTVTGQRDVHVRDATQHLGQLGQLARDQGPQLVGDLRLPARELDLHL